MSEKQKTSNSRRAGLTFPVGRVSRQLREGRYAPRVGVAGSVYLTAALEYLTAEIIELSGNAAISNKKQRIIPRHVLLAVRNDNELDTLLKDVTISAGGTMPNVNTFLLPSAKTKAEAKSAAAAF
jgi:histone H2A